MSARTGKTRPALVAAVAVAVISTVTAYLAMVQFGTGVLHMPAATAYICSGVFELSLVTVALLAREAARDNRPGGILLGLTWGLSATSGVFAAWHELVADAPLAELLGAAAFRFLTPLLAALMWHLALIGDRHLATGASWSGMRATMRMHALFLATEDLYRVQADHTGSRRALARAARRRRKARAIALRSVAPADMRAHCAAHVDAVKAQADADAEPAALHIAHQARLTDVLTGHTPTPTAPAVGDGYADLAADAVAAELDEITPATHPATHPATDLASTRPTGAMAATVAAASDGQPGRATRTNVRVRPANTRRASRPAGPVTADKTARLAVVADLVDARPDATTSDAVAALADAGYTTPDRTARRLLAEAKHTTSHPASPATDTTADHATDNTSTTPAPAEAAQLAEVN